MITNEQKQKLLNALMNHLPNKVRQEEATKIPIVLNSKENYISAKNGNKLLDDPELETINKYHFEDIESEIENADGAEIGSRQADLIARKHFHYEDKWYSYKYSVDEPQYTFGIIEVFNMPYVSFEGKSNKKSFIATMHNLLCQKYCSAFMIFVNRRFVSWDDIVVVFDCDRTYLLLYGEQYNWYVLNEAEIHMVILPFKADYIGIESDARFNMMYEITKAYIQDSLTEYSDGSMTINAPGMDISYEYHGMVYNIGAWLYTQRKYAYLGLLSTQRVNKLKKIDISKFEYDSAGNIINTFITKFNALDRDSYKQNLYDSICYMSKELYENNALFRFDDTGVINSKGSYIIVSQNSDIISQSFSSKTTNIVRPFTDIDNVLFRENFIVFKDDEFCPECNIEVGLGNAIHIDNPNKNKYTIYAIYNKQIPRVMTLYDNLDVNVMATRQSASYKNTIDDECKKYINDFADRLNYSYLNSLLYDENVENAYNEVIKYNPLLLNSLYHTNIESTVITGYRANQSLDLPFHYEDRRGLKIPRNKYENHESYIMVFEDGELLPEYYNMVAYPNFFFIPMDRSFNVESDIEILYFNHVNNNEIEFNITNFVIRTSMMVESSEWRKTNIFSQFIDTNDLKIFCKYPESILEYKSLVPMSDNIAFNISYRDEDNNLFSIRSVIDAAKNKTDKANTFTAVSSRKFIYQRLYVDQRAYRIELDKRFKYCDNQKQYVLFINGRRMNDDSFLITIPKHTRPFWGMYLYTSKFVNPEDRIELFYVPDVLININSENESILTENGYIECDRNKLTIPLDNNLYLVFVNGKKIPSSKLTSIDCNTLRLTKDTLSTNNIIINPINTDSLPEVVSYLHSQSEDSVYDVIIKYIKNTPGLGYDEIDRLLNVYTKISNVEPDKTKQNVAKIAILNEIIRDFWVTSGYQYNEMPFVYDYELDGYLYNDRNNNLILPSLDATQYINIIKNDVHLLYFNPKEEWHEIGSTIDKLTLSWEYANNLYTNINVHHQNISFKEITNSEYSLLSDLSLDAREYAYNTPISTDVSFKLSAGVGSNLIEAVSNIRFANGIYYGVVDEDQLQFLNNNQYDFGDETMLDPDIYAIFENDDTMYLNDPNMYIVLEDGTTIQNSKRSGTTKVVYEYADVSELVELLPNMNCNYYKSPELELNKFVVGNNNYFVYACPKRLAFDNNGNQIIGFYLPNPNSDDIIANCRDSHTTPIYTSGNYEIATSNVLESLHKMEMVYLGEMSYTNSSGYTEPYCIWRSNGFFTRLFDNYGLDIRVYYKDGSISEIGQCDNIVINNKQSKKNITYNNGDIYVNDSQLL